MATKPYRALPSELRWTHALARSSNRPCRVDAPPAAPRNGRSSHGRRGSGPARRYGGVTATAAGIAAAPGGSPSTTSPRTGTAAATTPPTSSRSAGCVTPKPMLRSDVASATAGEPEDGLRPYPAARRPRQRVQQAQPQRTNVPPARRPPRGVVYTPTLANPAPVAASLPFCGPLGYAGNLMLLVLAELGRITASCR